MSNLNEIRFYYPFPRFPSVSVTGEYCELRCKHCGGHYLQQMFNVNTPDKLRKFCEKLEKQKGTGLLISGGSTREGKVPLESFLETIKWVKKNTDLIINVHTGILEEKEAEELKATNIDIASVDIVGSEKTIHNVYGLNISPMEYAETLFYLEASGIPTVAPHICVGLNYGKILGEYKALDIIDAIEPEVLVILGLIPTKNTEMENIDPPAMEEILNLISVAREKFPKTSISLGCMRSRKDKHELEWLAIKQGIDRIATASISTIEKTKKYGYKAKILDGCCAVPTSLENKILRD